jgi:hypothetical protein
MKQQDKQKKVLKIADDLDGLGYSGIAQMLRDAVTSGKANSNETNEGDEGDDDTGGSNPPDNKPKPDKP